MALNAYLKIDGILGESQDDRHKGEIEILSFSWGASQAGAVAHGGGGGAGKVSMQDFHFTTKLSKASPMLFRACASGQHLPRAILTLRRAGDVNGDGSVRQEAAVLSQAYEIAPIDKLPTDGFVRFTLTDVMVSSYSAKAEPAPADGVPTDALSLNFAKIEFWYQAQAADGSVMPPVQLGWDLKRNAAF